MGEARLWECWKFRIFDDYSVRVYNLVKCHCGNIVGIDEGDYIKMVQHSFAY